VTKEKTFNIVQDIFRDIFEDNDLVINSETTADDIDEWDSLNHINIVASIEKKFSVSFALGELEDLKNVGEFIKLLEKKQ